MWTYPFILKVIPPTGRLDSVIRLFNRLERRLQPGEEKIVDIRKLYRKQTQKGHEDKCSNAHPEIQSQLTRPSVGDAAEQGISVHLAIDDADDHRDHEED